jgi:hypothetical protein
MIYLAGYVNPGTTLNGKLNMKTPPFKYIVPSSDSVIKVFVYWRNHLENIYTLPNFE